MNKIQKTVLTIINLLACLVIFVGVSYSWISANKSVDMPGKLMQINSESMRIVSYDVYHYNYDTDIFEAITDQNAYTMATYDTIFDDRNINTSLLFAIKVDQFPKNTSKLVLEIDCTADVPDGVNQLFTSNLVHVKAASMGTSQIVGLTSGTTKTTNCAALYKNAVTYFESNVSESARFLTATKDAEDNYTFEKSKTLLYELSLTKEEADAQDATFFLLFDYDKELIAAQPREVFDRIAIGGNYNSELMEAINYANDIRLITFTTETGDR